MPYDEAALLKAMDDDFARRHRSVQRDTAEWDHMWALLAALPQNCDQPCPTACVNEDCGEAWQYMGTWLACGQWQHQFRHRMHPVTGRREYVNLPVSASWADEQVVN